jgi:hypothetical protein
MVNTYIEGKPVFKCKHDLRHTTKILRSLPNIDVEVFNVKNKTIKRKDRKMKYSFDKTNALEKEISKMKYTLDYFDYLSSLFQDAKEAEELKHSGRDEAKEETPYLMLQTILEAESAIKKLASFQMAAVEMEFDKKYDLV